LFNWLVSEREFGERIKHLEELLLFKIKFLLLNKQADNLFKQKDLFFKEIQNLFV
jgi:hypothetical protein